MLDVSFPTTDGRCLMMPRYTEPEADLGVLLHQLRLSLPNQPPPRLAAAHCRRHAHDSKCSADLWNGSAENKGLPLREWSQLRKLG